MVQVLREVNPSPLNGRPRYNLDDYIRQRDSYEEGNERSKDKRKESNIIVTQEQL